MSELRIEDAGYAAIMADPQLANARRKLSLHEIRQIVNHARGHMPKHNYWGAGEPDCPRDIKAANGELHTLRCKVCGNEDARDVVCRPAERTGDDVGAARTPAPETRRARKRRHPQHGGARSHRTGAVSFVDERIIKATRKRHICEACDKWVEPGERAINWVGLSDGQFGAVYYHPECRVAEVAFNETRDWRPGDDWSRLCEDAEPDDHRWLKAEHPLAYCRMKMTREQWAARATGPTP